MLNLGSNYPVPFRGILRSDLSIEGIKEINGNSAINYHEKPSVPHRFWEAWAFRMMILSAMCSSIGGRMESCSGSSLNPGRQLRR
jgi:hypothetical protein